MYHSYKRCMKIGQMSSTREFCFVYFRLEKIQIPIALYLLSIEMLRILIQRLSKEKFVQQTSGM